MSINFNELTNIKQKILLFSDAPPGHHLCKENYVHYRFGSNEKKFEEKFTLDNWKQRTSREDKLSKKLIISRLNQCHAVMSNRVGEAINIAADLIYDCQCVVEELGVYLFVDYGFRTLKALAELDSDPFVDCAITAIRTCCIIGRNAIEKCSNLEILISDSLWAALYLIQDELNNSTPSIDKPTNRDDIEKPSFWDDFLPEKTVEKTLVKDFKNWIIQLKSRASVFALNRFLEEDAQNVQFESFSKILSVLNPDNDQVESRVFPVLPPPRFNTEAVKHWTTDRANRKYERSIRDQVKYGREYAKISGGAIMLICRDVPREFSFFGEANRPMAEFGIRFSHMDSFAQLPAKTKVWNIVTDYSKMSFVEDVREELYRLLKCEASQISTPTIQSPRKIKPKLISLDQTRTDNQSVFKLCSSIDSEIEEQYQSEHNSCPSKDIVKIIKKYCTLTPFLSDEFVVTYKPDPSDDKMVKAILSLPFDFPVTFVFESDYVDSETEAKYRVSLMVLSEVKNTCSTVWEWLNETDDEHEKNKKTSFEKEPKPDFDKVYQMKIADAVGTLVEKRSEIKLKLLEKFDIEDNNDSETIIREQLLKQDKQEERMKTKEELSIPTDHPLSSTDLYLYEIRMERSKLTLQQHHEKRKTLDSWSFEGDVWRPSDDQCFGILTPQPLGSIPQFELYDKIGASNSILGIITVSIVPIKSMIRLETDQLLALEHFHRVVALTNNACPADLKFYRDNANYTFFNKSKSHRFHNCLTAQQKYGPLNFLYVPISIGKQHQQLPWKGYDIDWGLITRHKLFEARMLKIAERKFEFDREIESRRNQQKPIRRRVASLEKNLQNNPDDQAMQQKVEEDKLELERMELELRKEKGTGNYYLGYHPLTGTCQVALGRHLKSMIDLQKKVYFTPWKQIDKSDLIHSKLNQTELPSHLYDWYDSDLMKIYPRGADLYTDIMKSDRKGTDMDPGTSRIATKQVTYLQYANKGYYKKAKDDKKKDEWQWPKYPTVKVEDQNLVRVKKHWMNKEDGYKMFLNKTFDASGVINTDEVKEVSKEKFHFMEHVEEFFLNVNMLNQSSRLSSVTQRVRQLVAMDEFRVYLSERSELHDSNIKLDKLECVRLQSTSLLFEDLSRMERCDSISILQAQQRRLPSRISNIEDTIEVEYSKNASNMTLSKVTLLGNIYPPPIIGGDQDGLSAFYIPPPLEEVSDKGPDYPNELVFKASQADKIKYLRSHVKEKCRRGWRQLANKRKPIGKVSSFCKDLFRSKRKLTIEDQLTTIENSWSDIDRRQVNVKTLDQSPVYIDWELVINRTRQFLTDIVSPSNDVETLLAEIASSKKHIDYFDLDEHLSFKSYMYNTEKDELVADNAKWLKNLLDRPPTQMPNIIDNEIMGPSPGLLLRCFTQESSREWFNLTRMEFIGDSFLKLATTRELYDDMRSGKTKFLEQVVSIDTPGKLTRQRSHYVCNAHLALLAKPLLLAEFMSVLPVNDRDNNIYPYFTKEIKILNTELFSDNIEDSKMSDKDSTVQWINSIPYQVIQDMKKLADTVESILGAYLVTGGEKMAAQLMNTLNYFYMEELNTTDDFLVCPPPSHWPSKDEPNYHLMDMREYQEPSLNEMINIRRIEKRISDSLKTDFVFRKKGLARLSLMMRGYDENWDNERLEFLGDAVLDYIVALEYYSNQAKYNSPRLLDVGDLTAAKQAMTSNNLFGSVAFVHQFVHQALNTNRKQLSQLEDFKVQLGTKYGIALNPDLERVMREFGVPTKASALRSPYLLDIPKWFGDVYEAVFGAIWLDSGQSLSVVKEILLSQIKHLMQFEIDDTSGLSKLSFKRLNPRKYLDQRGKVTILVNEKLKQKSLSKYPELNNEFKFIGKYACRMRFVKEGQTNPKEEIGLGSNENSAEYNTSTRMLEKLSQ